MFRPFFILIATAACTFAQTKTAVAQVEQPEKSTANAKEAEVREMVEKLGSASFADRQQAAKDLLNGGPESVALLETLAAEAIGETKFRLQMILKQLHKRLFEDELEAFLKEPSVGNAERLPEWERFKSICGDNEDALSIFGQILTAEPRLFATRLFATPRDLSALLESRTAELAIKCNGRSDEEFPVASVAAVMLLGSDSETRLIRGTSTNISSALDDPRFSHLITDGIHAKTLRAIVESWIVRPGIACRIRRVTR